LRAGLPVVASNLAGISTVIRDGENGLLVAPGDLASLTSALTRLEEQGSVLASLRRGAAASALDVRGWSSVAGQLHDHYARLRVAAARSVPSPDPELATVLAWPRSAAALPWESLEAQQWRRAA
jgi:ABC-type sugar transport system substrate-binding protein